MKNYGFVIWTKAVIVCGWFGMHASIDHYDSLQMSWNIPSAEKILVRIFFLIDQ